MGRIDLRAGIDISFHITRPGLRILNPAHIVLIEDNPGDILLVEMALKENNNPHKLTQFDNGLETLLVLCQPATADPLVPDARAAEIVGSFERTSGLSLSNY